MRDTDRDWNWIAAVAPYWGVLSDDRFRGIDIPPEQHETFFESGRQYIADVMGFIHHSIDPDFRPDRALDFGCGVGRLLLPLARLAREAVGVDVAPQMLDLAARHADVARLDNITFVAGDDHLNEVQGAFDFVNSFIVLQHIPPERGYRILHRLCELLRVGGIFSIQVAFAKSGKFLGEEMRSVEAYRRVDSKVETFAVERREPEPGTITMFDYDLNTIMLILRRRAGHPIYLLPTEHDGHFGVHLIGRVGQ